MLAYRESVVNSRLRDAELGAGCFLVLVGNYRLVFHLVVCLIEFALGGDDLLEGFGLIGNLAFV